MRLSFFIRLVFAVVVVAALGARATAGRPVRDAALDTAIAEYKASLHELLATLERSKRDAAAELDRQCDLFASHLVTRRDLDAKAAAVDELRKRIDAAKLELAEADFLAVEAVAPDSPSKAGRLEGSEIIRSDRGVWSIGKLSEVQRYFSSRFGHVLPVSAFGQTALHDHLGWDHRNAVDVALNPDGVEGRAMLDYLRRAGIPFLAFRSAIPGKATGPHIHIGLPSHRLAR